MKSDQFVFRSWHIYVILLLGTIVRVIYGLYAKNWMNSPDQLAWELSLNEAVSSGTISYRSLMHYPHEGGSFFISLITICLRPFENLMPPLTLAALLIETVGRFIQIKFTQRLFGSKVAIWFSVWTILSVPLLIPWATVNFGLHALFSFLPFIFLYYLTVNNTKYSKPLLCGIITGLSISMSYNSIIFIPAFIIYVFVTNSDPKTSFLNIGKYLVYSLITFLPHITARTFLDSGFELEDNSVFSIRGVASDGFLSVEHFRNFVISWHRVLPASFLLSSLTFISDFLQRDIVFVFMVLSMVLIAIKYRKNIRVISPGLLLIILYLLFYAFSPFYVDEIDIKSFVHYRHLTYITPLIFVIMIYAFLRFEKMSVPFLIAWLLLCGTGTIMLYQTTDTPEHNSSRATGCVIAQKYGNDVQKLMSIYKIVSPYEKTEIMIGYGWGLTSAILSDKTIKDSLSLQKLELLLNQFPSEQKELLHTGVQFAFSKNITPQLDPQILLMLEKKWVNL